MTNKSMMARIKDKLTGGGEEKPVPISTKAVHAMNIWSGETADDILADADEHKNSLQAVKMDPLTQKPVYIPVLAIDFIGVICSGLIPMGDNAHALLGEPVPGSIEWLTGLVDSDQWKSEMIQVFIYCEHRTTSEDLAEVSRWLLQHGMPYETLKLIRFPMHKPRSFMHIKADIPETNAGFPVVGMINAFVPYLSPGSIANLNTCDTKPMDDRFVQVTVMSPKYDAYYTIPRCRYIFGMWINEGNDEPVDRTIRDCTPIVWGEQPGARLIE